ncbi:MAG: pyrroloquinoline quinone precursor peptide PqqA [Lachnospiraceae bacterium]|nr:pyrroloquinoline quinone precursor peptide PqqA [Lachnospiraceae bacterium]
MKTISLSMEITLYFYALKQIGKIG